jgi:hypothetical protein
MLEFPSTITGLIQQIEAGNEPTPEQLRRVAMLQELAIAKIGEDFVTDMLAEDERRTKELLNL